MAAATTSSGGSERGPSPWLVPLLFVAVQAALQTLHHGPLAQTVENDFVGHAARAASWRAVFTVHGLYPLGYALTLRLVSLLTADPFLAAKLIAVLSAGLSLRVAYALGRDLFGPGAALAAQIALACNWHFQETALLVGGDQLASLIALLAIRALHLVLREPTARRALAGGALAGAAALVRQTSWVILPAFVAAAAGDGLRQRQWRRVAPLIGLALAAAAAAYAPQAALSWRQHGTPFYQTQASNVWFALHGDRDWRNRPADGAVSLRAIFRAEPRRLLTHWARESALGGARLAAMTAGALPPSLARRVRGPAPAACAVLTCLALLATAASVRRARLREIRGRLAPPTGAGAFLGLLVVGWVAAVGLAFSVSRFLLTPWIVVALAATAGFRWLGRAPGAGRDRRASIAQAAWVAALLANAGCAVYFTLRQGS